jgi:MGT family glycosyltransferase
MARLLVATIPLTGHVHPMLLLVESLVARGHEVWWTAARKFEGAIRRAGARYEPPRDAPDWDDADLEAAIPALRGRRGLARVKVQIKELFLAPMPAQLRDLEALADALAPDAVIGDSAHLGAGLLAEQRGIPWVGLGISALMLPSQDTAPFGSAQPPDRGGPAVNRFLNWLIFRVLFRDVNRAYRAARAAAGLPAGAGMYFEAISRDLFLQPTVPAFEYPRRDLPPQVRFIGPLVPRAPVDPAALPPWWSDVIAARERGQPIVLVTQGTLATDPSELIEPTLTALAEEPALVIATTGRGAASAEGRARAPCPANARLAPYVPYQALLPLASAMVTNGGYGGVQMALAHGVPLVVAGGSEEKPEIAARVAWSGAGIDLRTGRPRPRRLRAAVQRVLSEPRFGERARAVAAEMSAHDAPTTGAALIEQAIADAAGRARPVGRAPGAGRGAAVAVLLAIASGCGSFIDGQAAATTLRVLRASEEAARQLPDVQLAREAMPGGIVQLAAFARAYPRHREFQVLHASALCQYAAAFVLDDWEDAQLGGRDAEAAALAARLAPLLDGCEAASLALLPPAWRAARAAGGARWSAQIAGARPAEVDALRWIATVDAVRVGIDPARQLARLPGAIAALARCATLAPGGRGADAEILLGTLHAAARRATGSGEDGRAQFAAARAAAGEGALIVAVMEARALAADRAALEAALRRVLAEDPGRWPEHRLANELARRKATRYLAAAAVLRPSGAAGAVSAGGARGVE